MDIDVYISELLQENDIVNIAGLGCFLASNTPAGIDKSTNQLLPPSRKIVFEPKVKDETDILTPYVASKQNITTEQSQIKIKEFVKKCKEAAIDGNILVFNKMGKLSMNDEGDYIFTQDAEANLNKDAFGMKPVAAQTYKPQDTKKIIKEESKKQQKSKTPKPIDPNNKPKKKSKAWIILVVLGVIILAGAVYAYLNPAITKKYMNKVSLLIYKEHTHTPPQSPIYELNQTYSNMVLNDTTMLNAIYMFPFIDSTLVVRNYAYQMGPLYVTIPYLTMVEPEIVVEKETEMVSKVPTTDISGKRFHIIAGSFVSKRNAEKYNENLKGKGYPNSSIFYSTVKELYRVSYNSFATREEALRELRSFRRGIDPSAWVIQQ